MHNLPLRIDEDDRQRLEAIQAALLQSDGKKYTLTAILRIALRRMHLETCLAAATAEVAHAG